MLKKHMHKYLKSGQWTNMIEEHNIVHTFFIISNY